MNKNAHYFLIFPWIVYLFVIFLFRVKYVDFNIFAIYPIIISIFLSIIFYFFGLNIGQIQYKKSHISNEHVLPDNEPKYIRTPVKDFGPVLSLGTNVNSKDPSAESRLTIPESAVFPEPIGFPEPSKP